jgi:hypothetical protein
MSTAQFGVLWGLNLYFHDCTSLQTVGSEVKQFRGFLHRISAPIGFSRIFLRVSLTAYLQHIDFTENIYRILIKQTG